MGADLHSVGIPFTKAGVDFVESLRRTARAQFEASGRPPREARVSAPTYRALFIGDAPASLTIHCDVGDVRVVPDEHAPPGFCYVLDPTLTC